MICFLYFNHHNIYYICRIKEFKDITDRCNQKCHDVDKKFCSEKEYILEVFGL